MDFCAECNNLLFIEEDLDKKSIYYCCITCNYKKNIEDSCVYKKIYKKTTNLYQNNKYLNDDPTLPKNIIKCPNCDQLNANVYYQRHDLTIVYVCKNCKLPWNCK